MPVVGLTGGIATGKSAFARLLLQHLPADFFDADACSRSLLESDPEVLSAVREAFGTDVITATGSISRSRLRAVVFAQPAQRAALEAILHPRIRARWLALAEAARRAQSWLLIDIPLLYETQAELLFDRVMVVACSPATQLRRLENERTLPPQLAAQIVAAQLPLETKMARADYLIWNNSTIPCLAAQAGLLARSLQRRHE